MNRHPKDCGESTYIGGAPICKAALTPCPVVYRDEECAIDKLDRLTESLVSMARKTRDESKHE